MSTFADLNVVGRDSDCGDGSWSPSLPSGSGYSLEIYSTATNATIARSNGVLFLFIRFDSL